MSVTKEDQLLNALLLLIEHYEDLWREYEEGNHIKQYTRFLEKLQLNNIPYNI